MGGRRQPAAGRGQGVPPRRRRGGAPLRARARQCRQGGADALAEPAYLNVYACPACRSQPTSDFPFSSPLGGTSAWRPPIAANQGECRKAEQGVRNDMDRTEQNRVRIFDTTL